MVSNIVMKDIESRAIKTSFYAPSLWKQYVDDTFVLTEQGYLINLDDRINNIEPSIKFTMETETNGYIPFLDVY